VPRHDVLLAGGAAAERWLDCGNRNFFMNVVDYLALGLPDQEGPQPFRPLLRAIAAKYPLEAAAVARQTDQARLRLVA
jgi:hypothetical protein